MHAVICAMRGERSAVDSSRATKSKSAILAPAAQLEYILAWGLHSSRIELGQTVRTPVRISTLLGLRNKRSVKDSHWHGAASLIP